MSVERSGTPDEQAEDTGQDSERKEDAENADEKSVEESEESFPASDPPSW